MDSKVTLERNTNENWSKMLLKKIKKKKHTFANFITWNVWEEKYETQRIKQGDKWLKTKLSMKVNKQNLFQWMKND